MSKLNRESSALRKRAWVKPELKVIAAGSAEADLSLDIKDSAANTKS